MILQVKEFRNTRNLHVCIDESGKTHMVDLMVSAELTELMEKLEKDYYQFCQFLIGKTIEVESLTPAEEIANGIAIVSDSSFIPKNNSEQIIKELL